MQNKFDMKQNRSDTSTYDMKGMGQNDLYICTAQCQYNRLLTTAVLGKCLSSFSCCIQVHIHVHVHSHIHVRVHARVHCHGRVHFSCSTSCHYICS